MKKIFPILALLLVLLTGCPKKDVDPPNNNGDTKIGYLFYSSFISDFNNSLFQAFTRFKTAGVTDLIIDLRYNHGGSLTAASYLASLIAPKSVVESRSVFTQLDYNSFLNDAFGNNRKYFLTTDALGANLNLKTVYIIATSDSYSASELLTFCLRPYVKVVHVGESTGGKFTASFTVTPFDGFSNQAATVYTPTSLSTSAKDSLKNWAMQPIVAIYKDSRNADFSNPGTLIPDVAVESKENSISSYKPIGDPSDYLLSATIALITSKPASSTQTNTSPRTVISGLQPAKLFSGKADELTKEAVNLGLVKASSHQASVSAGTNVVSKFVYDGLGLYYKWSGASGFTLPAPTQADNDPEAYFYRILYPLDTQHGWSWITDDVNELLAGFSGTPLAFGWAFNYFWADATKTKIIAVVKYVYPNTPASRAGIKRGDVVTQVNGADLTTNSGDPGFYGKLSGGNTITVTTNTGSASLTPQTISTNPVLKDTVYIYKK